MRSNTNVEQLANSWKLFGYFSANSVITVFIYGYILGFGFWDAIDGVFVTSQNDNELGRLGLGPTMDLLSLLNFWVFLQLPVLSMALILTNKNPHRICAVVFQIPFILMIFFHIATIFYIFMYHFGFMFFNTGEPFQGSVIKIGTVLILEAWLLMPSMMLLLEKVDKARNRFPWKMG